MASMQIHQIERNTGFEIALDTIDRHALADVGDFHVAVVRFASVVVNSFVGVFIMFDTSQEIGFAASGVMPA